jgi:hypothetical protein
MKNSLTKVTLPIYHMADGQRVDGPHPGISGDVSGISGNASDISGNVTGISGDLDECKITDEERINGIHIEDLLK